MTDIGLTAKIGDSSTKFEIWFRKRKPNDTFTLQAMSEDVKKAWTEELSQLLWKQAIKNRGKFGYAQTRAKFFAYIKHELTAPNFSII